MAVIYTYTICTVLIFVCNSSISVCCMQLYARLEEIEADKAPAKYVSCCVLTLISLSCNKTLLEFTNVHVCVLYMSYVYYMYIVSYKCTCTCVYGW